MRIITSAIALFALALSIAACGSHNVGGATTGDISGSITLDGPINGAVDLQIGLFTSDLSVPPVETTDVGHVRSAVTATLSGRAIAFSFTDVAFGTYTVRLYATGVPNNTYY